MQNQIDEIKKKNHRWSIWKKIVTSLACVVVFCTVYALILPAITLEGDTYCGKEEHQHSEECYTREVIEVKKNLICDKEEQEPHTHGDSCYEIRIIEEIVEEIVEEEVEVEPELPEEETTTEENVDESVDEGVDEAAIEYIQESSEETPEPTQSSQVETVKKVVEKVVEREEKVLICEKEETQGHSHGEDCYEEETIYGEEKLTCEKEEHQHTTKCHANNNADVETEEEWKATFAEVKFTNDWPADALAIAKTQLGYKESTENYIVLENGDIKGYTRYGDFYGDDYGEWCAMFVSFCLHYAEVEDFPLEANCQNWIVKLQDLEEASKDKEGVVQYNAWQESTEKYIPKKGNIIFFNWDAEADSDHVGFVYDTKTDEDGNVTVITLEGNASETVKYKEYDLNAETIMGYGILPDQGYYCEVSGHAHDKDCYDGNNELTCEAEEHTHTEDCKEKPETDEEKPIEEIIDESEKEVKYTQVSVTKHWTEAPGESEVYVQLYANGEAVNDPVELNSDNNWTYTWNELAVENEYTIQEVTVEGYKSHVEKLEPEQSRSQVWKLIDSTEDIKANEQYMLVRNEGARSDSEDGLCWTNAYLENVSACSESAIWLTRETESGEIQIYNKETEKLAEFNLETEGFDIYGLIEIEIAPADNKFVVTNSKVREGIETVEISVTKKWEGRPDNIYPESVEVQLMQNGNEYSMPITLNESNSWTGNWTQLPKMDQEGKQFEYTVEEIGADGYTASQEVTQEEDKYQITLTNTWTPKTVAVTLQKVDANDVSKALEGAEFDLYLKTKASEESVPGTDDIYGILLESITVDEKGIAVSELTVGETYYLVETKAPNGYNALIEPIGFTVTEEEENATLTLEAGKKWAEVISGDTITLIVKNTNGYVLPKVGGHGTTTYIMAGLLLMCSAAYLMYTKRRKESEK